MGWRCGSCEEKAKTSEKTAIRSGMEGTDSTMHGIACLGNTPHFATRHSCLLG